MASFADCSQAFAPGTCAAQPASASRARMFSQFGLHPAVQVNGLMTIFQAASSTTALRPRRLEALLRTHRENGAQQQAGSVAG